VWNVFDLMLNPALVRTPDVSVPTRLPWILHHQARVFRQRALKLVGILLLAVLASYYIAPGSPLPRSRVRPRNVPLVSFSPDTLSLPVLKSSDWPTYHHDNARTGYLANEPDPKRLIAAWTAKLDNAVYAEPLVIGERVIVATEGDTLYSLDARTGRVQWHTNVGHPVPLSTLNCGGHIDLLGITGTPVYDPTTGLVFAVAEVTGPVHLLVGIDLTTGKLRIRRPVDVPAMAAPIMGRSSPRRQMGEGLYSPIKSRLRIRVASGDLRGQQ
jgi:PQQ-like domain